MVVRGVAIRGCYTAGQHRVMGTVRKAEDILTWEPRVPGLILADLCGAHSLFSDPIILVHLKH